MRKNNKADSLRQALKTGNLQSIEQASPKKFCFFGRKGPFKGFDFLPDGPDSINEKI